MKRIISTMLALAILATCVLSLASCGNSLSGKYQSKSGITTYEFSGKTVKITYEVDIPIVGTLTKTIEGTYELTTDDDGNDSIIFAIESEEDGANNYEGEFSFAKGTEDGKDYIKIGGSQYFKAE